MNEIINDGIKIYLDSLRCEKDERILKMEHFARENKIPILDWQAAELLEQITLLIKPDRVLEIGTAIGYTSSRIALLLSENARLDTIELSRDNISLAEENFRKMQVEDKINLIKGNALEIIPTLKDKYELIFLDADKEDYLEYYEKLLPVLEKGGVLFIDNLLWKGNIIRSEVDPEYKPSTDVIRELNRKIMNDSRVFTTILTVGDGVGICIKK